MNEISNQKMMSKNNERSLFDRRQHKFKSFIFSLYKGRRRMMRRQEEAVLPYYTDVYENWVGMLVITVTCLSVLDAFLTLNILAGGGTELNPVMLALLEINIPTFIIVKVLLTSFSLIFLLVHINFSLLKIFPMRAILIAIGILYCGLIGYEVILLSL